MILLVLACTEERTDAEGQAGVTAVAETAADCVPTEDVHQLSPMLIRFDASAAMDRARAADETATKLEVWILSLTFEEYDQKRCDDALKNEYLMGAVLQDLTEYTWLDVDLTGAEGWSVVAATMNETNETVERWFGEVGTSTDGAATITL